MAKTSLALKVLFKPLDGVFFYVFHSFSFYSNTTRYETFPHVISNRQSFHFYIIIVISTKFFTLFAPPSTKAFGWFFNWITRLHFAVAAIKTDSDLPCTCNCCISNNVSSCSNKIKCAAFCGIKYEKYLSVLNIGFGFGFGSMWLLRSNLITKIFSTTQNNENRKSFWLCYSVLL